MTEVSFIRRATPAVLLAIAGGILLYLLPSGADSDMSAAEDLGSLEPATASAGPVPGASGASSSSPDKNGKRTIKGDAIKFRFGVVQVKVTLDGTTIANITTLKAPGGGYQGYTDRAIPDMKSKILAAQSTRVAAASGATYTSQAYAMSVQSALDRA